MQDTKKHQFNSAIDVTKLIMAVLVIGIHTEPFNANIWLDRGFGIVTRLCIPFFFITSAYFFFKNGKPLKTYLSRIILLYVIWSFVYLPFDLPELRTMNFSLILKRYLWDGNEHALWYLQASIIGAIIVSGFRKLFGAKRSCIISFILLAIGCLFSTYLPFINDVARGGYCLTLMNILGTRNGLFYAPAYISMGLWFAENGFSNERKKHWVLLVCSLFLLIVESAIFVVNFKTASTILWLSVYPASYAFFYLAATTKCHLQKSISVWMRKLSVSLYVVHGLFLMAFNYIGYGFLYFAAVFFSSVALSAVIICLSGRLKFLKYFY